LPEGVEPIDRPIGSEPDRSMPGGQHGTDAEPGIHPTDPRRPMARPDLRTGNR
jgi:hypothetical protein